jgi:hypothetical protein
MDKESFRPRAITTFRNLKYIFAEEVTEGRTLPRLSVGNQVVAGAAASVAFGLIGALSVHYPEFGDSQVKAEMEKLENICDVVGVRLDTGGALLALFIFGDDLTAEALIGKSVMIRDRLKTFKDFTMRLGWFKRGVIADVFFTFADSEKAFQFRHSVQKNCKHGEFFAKLYVLPWCIDISAKSVSGYSGWPPPGYMSGLRRGEIEAKLFG